ncbi:MAG: phosphorylase [Bacillales bacterium]|jgi:diadenosine tetraphosphate (Ap4A) HIT family hydrolase|nr:phosphorylase [Bacillales bacterium]
MTCVFCEGKFTVVLENNLAVGFYDKYPVQKGHLLIIPKRHIKSYFDVSQDELSDIHKLILEGKKIIDTKFSPDGYNVGVNIGEFGGQTVPHLHFHLIPRYKGDIDDPRGGIRKMIPNLVQYP